MSRGSFEIIKRAGKFAVTIDGKINEFNSGLKSMTTTGAHLDGALAMNCDA